VHHAALSFREQERFSAPRERTMIFTLAGYEDLDDAYQPPHC